MNVSTRIERIINKIIKNNNIKKHIHQLLSQPSNHSYIKQIIYLSKLIHRNKEICHPPKTRTYISNKLSNYLLENHYSKDMTIVDIGGGNGQILKEIGENMKLPKEQLYCVEPNIPWTEPYSYLHNDFIQYVFWDNLWIPIQDHSIDVVFMMVSLHHMTDETIKKTMENIVRISKPNSVLIVKEHDCVSNEDRYVIEWEHHLYHLVETCQQNEEKCKDYMNNFIQNYKSKMWINDLMMSYGFHSVMELNRLFERNVDTKNPTNLYWKIFTK